MCGFITIIRRNAPIRLDELKDAVAVLEHRGPDAFGFHIDTIETANGTISIGMGHARLSILDPDARGNQPFIRNNTNLVYNGEIYNFQALKSELCAAGATFETDCDTEVLSAILQRDQTDPLAKLNGQWAFVFASLKEQRVLAGRDRFGKKPLFYALTNDEIIFASTCAAIDRVRGAKLRFDRAYLQSFVHHYQCLLWDETSPFEGIQQVRPSHVLELDLARWSVQTRRYFELGGPVPEADALPDLLIDAVGLRLVSDRPVSLLLSGGIDSSLLLAVLHAQGLADQVTCFIGDSGVTEDAAYGVEVAKTLGIAAQIVNIETNGGAFDQFLHLCQHQEALFDNHGMMSMSAMYREIARTDCKVVLDGTGGDEVFGGYWDRQFPIALREALKAGKIGWLAKMCAAHAGNPKLLARSLRWMRNSASNYVDPQVQRFARPSSPKQMCPMQGTKIGFVDALERDLIAGRMSDWLWQNDRNAMSYGLEARSPLMDHRLAAYIRTGFQTKFNGRYNKMELRRAFDVFAEVPTQWRVQKQGFNWQKGAFLRSNQDKIRELIAASKVVDEVFDREALLRASNDDAVLVGPAFERAMTIAGVEAQLGAS